MARLGGPFLWLQGLGWQHGLAQGLPFLPCPRCGARLLTKTEERPPRLVCVDCRQVLPQNAQVPIITLVVRHFLGVMLLLGLVVVPLLVMSLSPWIDRVPRAPRTNLSATR